MQKVNETTNQQVEPKNIVICGAGPGGLATAIEALNSKHKVTIIESRDKEETTLRPQLVMVTKETINFLEKNVKADDPILLQLELLKKVHGHIAIKDIQSALIRKLEEEKLCTFLYNTHVSKVDMEKGVIHIQQQGKNNSQDSTIKTIDFDHLVDATGTNHAIANLLKGSTHAITHEPIPSRINQNHLVGYFKLKNRLQYKFPTDGYITKVNLPNGHLCLIYADHYPYEKSKGEFIKVNVVASVSENINNKDNHEIKNEEINKKTQKEETEKQIDYLKKCLQFAFPMWDVIFTSSKKHPKKDPLKIQPTQFSQFEASNAFIQVGKKTLELEADSFRTPDFYQGHGLNDAILYAQELGKVFANQIDINTYNQYCKEKSMFRTKVLLGTDIQQMQAKRNFLDEIIERLETMSKLQDVNEQEKNLLISLRSDITSNKDNLVKINEKILSTENELQKLNQNKLPSSALIFINALNGIWNSQYNVSNDSISRDDKIKKQETVLKEVFEKQEQARKEEEKRLDSLEPAFIQAVRKKDLNQIKHLIEEKAPINGKDRYGNTALIVALRQKDYAIAKELILAKADLNIPGSNGDTALHLAAIAGQIEIVNLLIDNGCNQTLTDSYNKNYLYYLNLSIVSLYQQRHYDQIYSILEHKNLDLTCKQDEKDISNLFPISKRIYTCNRVLMISDDIKEVASDPADKYDLFMQERWQNDGILG